MVTLNSGTLEELTRKENLQLRGSCPLRDQGQTVRRIRRFSNGTRCTNETLGARLRQYIPLMVERK